MQIGEKSLIKKTNSALFGLTKMGFLAIIKSNIYDKPKGDIIL